MIFPEWGKMKIKLSHKIGICILIMNIIFLASACSGEEQTGLSEYTLEEQNTSEEAAKRADLDEHASDSEKSEEPVSVSEKDDMRRNDAEKSGESGKVTVYVCGAVFAPGVYELAEGSRVCDAVSEAGGVREDASEASVNQARLLVDGEQIYIPTEEEADQGAFVSATPVSETKDSMHTYGKVNLNTAAREELMTLNGIGAARADEIILYREKNGPFRSIEELMLVDGIKEGIFEKLKDGITVN